MEINVQKDCAGVDWESVRDILKSVGMSYHEAEKLRRAFAASHTTVFLYDGTTLIGFGRAMSDGEYQAAIYDCALRSDYQGKGLGSMIIETILAEISHCNIILYATPGKEGFYQKHEFGRMKTGMALFIDQIGKRARGFIE